MGTFDRRNHEDILSQLPPTPTPGIPRRIQRDQWTPAELAIGRAMDAVEAAGADVRLTDAGVLLQAARDSVADYVDGVMVRRAVSITEAMDAVHLQEARAELRHHDDVVVMERPTLLPNGLAVGTVDTERLGAVLEERRTLRAENARLRGTLVSVAEALRVPLSEACEYEGRLEANVCLPVGALHTLRLCVRAVPEGSPDDHA